MPRPTRHRLVSVANNDNSMVGVTAIRPPKRSRSEAIRLFIYDPDGGTYLGRTPKSWVQILLFYSVFYTCLFAFWYAYHHAYMTTIGIDRPKYVLKESCIGSNPGLGFRPNPPSVDYNSGLISLKAKPTQFKTKAPFDTRQNVDWAKRYEQFLERYNTLDKTYNCSNDDAKSNHNSDACRFDKSTLKECGEWPYGYLLNGTEKVTPCVLIKINRIYDWIPQPYSDEDLQSTEAIPTKISERAQKTRRRVYINCEGVNPADREALNNKLQYFPEGQAIPFKFFPFRHSLLADKTYHTPVVAVRFSDLPLGQIVRVACKLYAKGIKHNIHRRKGSVRFDIVLNE